MAHERHFSDDEARAVFAGMGAGLVVLLTGLTDEGWKAGLWGAALLVAARVVLVGGIPAVRGSMRRQAAEAEATLDRLDLIARATVASAPTPFSAAPRLALSDDEPSASLDTRDSDQLRTR